MKESKVHEVGCGCMFCVDERWKMEILIDTIKQLKKVEVG